MISKKYFIEILTFVKNQAKKQEEFIKALESLSPGSYCDCFLFNDYEDHLIDLLHTILNDKHDDLYYFLYELDWINRDELDKNSFPKDKKGNILYNSLETLYEYLTKEKK